MTESNVPTNKKIAPIKLWQVLVISGIFLLIIGLSFLAGYWYSNDYAKFRNTNFPLFDRAYLLLLDHGLNPIPDSPLLEYGLIRGMLQSYNDPYTILVEPPQHELQTNRLEGKFGGIGVRLDLDTQHKYRLYPFPDSPAQKAGLIDGDILVQVAQIVVTEDTDRDTIQAAIRGPVGEQVDIVIFRDVTDETLIFEIERAEIPIPSVTWNLIPENQQVGILRVNIIAATTPTELENGFRDLMSQGAGYFILDLRDNSGGLVDAGVNIARLFLERGSPILEQQYRDQRPQTFKSEKDGEFIYEPMVVLINQGTASAAEIVAGALKNQSRAIIVGSPSYGKDTIQLVFDLGDGSSMHVTAARWWIPGLEPSIGGIGVQPDVLIPSDSPNEEINTLYTRAAISALLDQ